MDKRFQRILFAVSMVIAVISIYVFFGQRNIRIQALPAPEPSVLPESSVATPLPIATQPKLRPTSRSHAEYWRSFGARFGSELKEEKSADGRTVAIRGAPGRGDRAGGRFSPRDIEQVHARAREILNAASELLGLDPGLPLGEPTLKTGPVSAQAYFPETIEGLPMAPFGSVLVDLGPQGEILNLSSDYASGVKVVNQRRLSAEQAKVKAEAAVPDPGTTLSTLGGKEIVWVTRDGPGGANIGHRAYDYNVAGRQIVIDAESGVVLFRRDRREY